MPKHDSANIISFYCLYNIQIEPSIYSIEHLNVATYMKYKRSAKSNAQLTLLRKAFDPKTCLIPCDHDQVPVFTKRS